MLVPITTMSRVGIMSQIISFPTPAPRDGAVREICAGELVPFGRNDLATVIETIGLLRDAGLTDMLDEFNRGPVVTRRRRAANASA